MDIQKSEVETLCDTLLAADEKKCTIEMSAAINQAVSLLKDWELSKRFSGFSNEQVVGGSSVTVLYSPNFSADFRLEITESSNCGDNGLISVDELLHKYLDPLGEDYGTLDKERKDFVVLNAIKEDYVTFS